MNGCTHKAPQASPCPHALAETFGDRLSESSLPSWLSPALIRAPRSVWGSECDDCLKEPIFPLPAKLLEPFELAAPLSPPL